MQLIERTVQVGDVRLAVWEAGVGGRPLLLLHGYTGNKSDFESVMPVLAMRGWHVVAPDHRGHGASTNFDDEDAYSFDLFADDALALLAALGWDCFSLLGHSMGGMIAQTIALRVPERLDALILMDTSHCEVPIDPGVVELALPIAREHGLAMIVAAQRDMADPLESPAWRWLADNVPGWQDRGEENMLMCSAAMFVSMMIAITTPHDGLADLASVGCPTLVIVGEQDKPFLGPSAAMAETIPNARLVVVDDAGHSPQFENPGGYLSALVPFLDAVHTS